MKRTISIYFSFLFIISLILPNNSYSAVFSYDETTGQIYTIEENSDGSINKREISPVEFAKKVGEYPQVKQLELLRGGQSSKSFFKISQTNQKIDMLTENGLWNGSDFLTA